MNIIQRRFHCFVFLNLTQGYARCYACNSTSICGFQLFLPSHVHFHLPTEVNSTTNALSIIVTRVMLDVSSLADNGRRAMQMTLVCCCGVELLDNFVKVGYLMENYLA
jgi:hypothetical protein